jgi:hypothetical protein
MDLQCHVEYPLGMLKKKALKADQAQFDEIYW